MMPQTVPPHGPKTAKTLIIGETPWLSEIAAGKPFAGPSGHKLRQWCAESGIDFDLCRLENVCLEKPPANPQIETLGATAIIDGINALRERIREYSPNVVVTLGNYPTFALTGLTRVLPAMAKHFDKKPRELAGITKIRGGVFDYQDGDRVLKVIPSIHPSAVLRCGYSPHYESRCVHDWRFIAAQSKFPWIEKREEDFYFGGDEKTTKTKCREMLERCARDWNLQTGEGRPLAIDIETWSGGIDCVGFACSPKQAVVVPIDSKTRSWAIPLIRHMCGTSYPKVLQNGLYDTYWLKRYLDIDVNNYRLDTQAMHHALDPAESHSLDFLASIYTFPRLNYWKDEAKTQDDLKGIKSREMLFRYNCKDTTATWEISQRLTAELTKAGRYDFYLNHYQRLFRPLLKMMLKGFRVNTVVMSDYSRILKTEMEKIRRRLELLAGFDLYAEKGFSPIALREFLIDVLGCDPIINRDRSETMNEKALVQMRRQHPENRDIINMILRHREIEKERGYLSAYDIDGRVRCEYAYRTDTGRLSSRKNPMRTGLNLQNIKR